jgi:hypothetical protein
MENDTDADLFPWILGSVLITTAAVATLIASIHTPASNTPKTPSRSATSLSTSAPTVPTAPPAPIQAPPTIQPAAHDALPPGTVWECVVDGERTFSDAPCGAHSSIRQLSELNLMDSARARSVSYVGYDQGYAPPTTDQYPPDLVNYTNVNTEVIVIDERMRRGHPSRQSNHIHARPRKE